MGLRTYRQKRDFTSTPEPSGSARRGNGHSFVIQKHAARRLHHDFRLELGGVLLSWAVPKGPPVTPGQKVLAVRTEDHPLDYGSFEGVIPAGQYGGGTVMLWDRGTWSMDGNARKGLAAGKLDFELHGERLRGRWSLVRMAKKTGDKAENWLLIKRHDRDASARAPRRAADRSVASGRSMQEIAAAADRTWSSDGEAAPARASATKKENQKRTKPKQERQQKPAATPTAADLPGARRGTQPTRPQPQLATLVATPPEGDAWLHEMKFDGYRLLACRDGGKVRLLTRTGQDWTARFAGIAAAVARLPVKRAVLDGEVVVLGANGISDFQALQNSLERGDGSRPVYFVFDLPFCDGVDLTGCELRDRKRVLEPLLAAADAPLRYSEHVVGNGPAFWREACRMGLEGIVSKRADSHYQQRRTRSWLKVKCLQRQEFVVGGYTDPAGSRGHFGALLLGVFDGGELRYAGKVGTGFTATSLAQVAKLLAQLPARSSPFAEPPRGAEAKGAHWVQPRCVVEVAFTEWTQDDRLRHPSFQGVRQDRQARSVHRERPKAVAAAPAPTPRTGTDNVADTIAGVRLSHPERVLYGKAGITKRDLAGYYERVAEHVLPHVVGRPLTIVRCPQGSGSKCFYQKHVTDSLPAPVRAVAVRESGGTADYLAIDDLAGLVTLVQFGALELHPWGSRADRVERPDRIVLDLDPGPDVPWSRVVSTAQRLRERLAELGLQSFARTTGGKGLHVVLPIERRSSWDEVKQFSRDVVAAVAREQPEQFVLQASKAQRRGRIFLDYLRNGRGATAVASYSSRARAGAPVAMPVRWEEVNESLDPAAFTVATVPARLQAEGDAWPGFHQLRQTLTQKARAAVGKS